MFKTLMQFGLAAGLCSVSSQASAARSWALLLGSDLRISSPCARSVEIVPDPGLHGAANITALADHQEEIDRLIMKSADDVTIAAADGECWRPPASVGFRPTLVLHIRVPAGFAIALEESGVGDYRIGDVGGDLDLDMSGASRLVTGLMALLSADLSGASEIDIAKAVGKMDISLSGAGHMRIRSLEASEAEMALSGAGSITINAGEIGSLQAEQSGFGDIDVGAIVHDADIDLSGQGNVKLARVTGDLHRDVSGLGEVTVGE